MAESKIGICRDVAPTSTGAQVFTFTDLDGATPVAVWFEWTYATTNAAAANHVVIGFGAATGASEEWACCHSSENAASPSDTYRRGIGDGCILILNPADGTVDGEAEFTSFGAGTVTVNWVNAPSAGFLIVVKAFYCDNAHAGTFTPSATVDTATDITAPGFAGNLMYLAGILQGFDDYSYSYGSISYGYATSASQGALFHMENSSATTAACFAYLSNAYAVVQAGYGGFSYGVEISNWDASGFSQTPRIAGNSEGDDVGYLLLDIEESVVGGTYALATSTGNDAHTGVGFQPQFMTGTVSQLTALNTNVDTAAGGAFGAFVVNDNYEYSLAVNSDDGKAQPTDNQSLADNRVINLPQDNGATGYEADFVSFDADGWTWDITDAMGTATYGWYTAIEAVAGTAIPVMVNLYRRLR